LHRIAVLRASVLRHYGSHCIRKISSAFAGAVTTLETSVSRPAADCPGENSVGADGAVAGKNAERQPHQIEDDVGIRGAASALTHLARPGKATRPSKKFDPDPALPGTVSNRPR